MPFRARILPLALAIFAFGAAAEGCGGDGGSSKPDSGCSGPACSEPDAAVAGGGAAGGRDRDAATMMSPTTAAAGSGGAPRAGNTGAAGSAGGAGAAGMQPAASGSGGAGASGGSPAPAAGSGGSPAPSGMCVACQAYLAPAELAKVQTSDLAELSGLAIGHQNPQLIFAHNDRARAVVFVLDRQGGVKARLSLENAMPTDVEDIAIAACAKDSRDSCVYLADIGDNASQRSEIAVLRFAEPALPASDAVTMLSPMFTRLRFRYEDGAHNAEGFMVDPATARMYVVTKLMDGGVSSVYRLDEGASADAVGTAVKVAALPVPMSSDMSISAAAAQPCGGGFVVRTYNTIYEFRIPVGMPFEQAFSVAPVTIAAPTENQSEAIDYLPDGRGLVTSGEGASAAIFEMRCEP